MSYTTEHFRPFIDKKFKISNGEGHVNADLIEVKDLVETSDGKRVSKQFSVLWKSNDPVNIEQGVYTVSAEGFEEQSFFIVTTGEDGDGMLYEAVFT